MATSIHSMCRLHGLPMGDLPIQEIQQLFGAASSSADAATAPATMVGVAKTGSGSSSGAAAVGLLPLPCFALALALPLGAGLSFSLAAFSSAMRFLHSALIGVSWLVAVEAKLLVGRPWVAFSPAFSFALSFSPAFSFVLPLSRAFVRQDADVHRLRQLLYHPVGPSNV